MKKAIYIFTVCVATVVFAVASPAVGMETAKIGFCAPLSGPAAAWGLPGMDGLTIFVDKVNARGGLKVGDKAYKLEIVAYDDEGDGAKALLGVKKLVLEDKVKVMILEVDLEKERISAVETLRGPDQRAMRMGSSGRSSAAQSKAQRLQLPCPSRHSLKNCGKRS